MRCLHINPFFLPPCILTKIVALGDNDSRRKTAGLPCAVLPLQSMPAMRRETLPPAYVCAYMQKSGSKRSRLFLPTVFPPAQPISGHKQSYSRQRLQRPNGTVPTANGKDTAAWYRAGQGKDDNTAAGRKRRQQKGRTVRKKLRTLKMQDRSKNNKNDG